MAGAVYNREENDLARSYLSSQNNMFLNAENDSTKIKKDVLRIGILIAVSAIVMILLKKTLK